jgi:hypothetical protein
MTHLAVRNRTGSRLVVAGAAVDALSVRHHSRATPRAEAANGHA